MIAPMKLLNGRAGRLTMAITLLLGVVSVRLHLLSEAHGGNVAGDHASLPAHDSDHHSHSHSGHGHNHDSSDNSHQASDHDWVVIRNATPVPQTILDAVSAHVHVSIENFGFPGAVLSDDARGSPGPGFQRRRSSRAPPVL